jgi:CubicO group peptidase (beta-lactamase class C family)
MHARTGDASFDVIPFEVPQAPEFFMGGGGLYSTARDYPRLLRALLNGGRNQIGEIAVGPMKTVDPGSSNDAEFFPGMPKRWGLASMLNLEEAPTGRSAGSLAWAGLANTYFWLDPSKRVAGLILTQILPFADQAVLDLFSRFERAVYDSVSA